MSGFSKEIEELLAAVRARIEAVATRLEELGSLAAELARARKELGGTGDALSSAIEKITRGAEALRELAVAVNRVLDGYEEIIQAILSSDFAKVKASVDALCADVARIESEISRKIEDAVARINSESHNGIAALGETLQSISAQIEALRDAVAAENHRSQTILAEMHQDLINRSGGIEEQIREGFNSVRTKGTENTDTLRDAVAAENRELRVALGQAFQMLSRQQKQNTNAVIVTGIIGVVVVCGVIAYLHYFA